MRGRSGIGIAGCATSLMFVGTLVHRRRFDGEPELRRFFRVLGPWSILAGAMATVAVWEIVGATAFGPAVSLWLTLANGGGRARLPNGLNPAALEIHDHVGDRQVELLPQTLDACTFGHGVSSARKR